MSYRHLLKSSNFAIVVGIIVACAVVGCNNPDNSQNVSDSKSTERPKVMPTPPPNFDVKNAQAQINAGQQGAEELRKKIEGSKK